MIHRRDMDTDDDLPDVAMPWTRILAAGFWGLVLLAALAPVCGARAGVRLRAMALRALGRRVATRPTLEEMAGRGGGR